MDDVFLSLTGHAAEDVAEKPADDSTPKPVKEGTR
jgi:hypothetical protein